MAKKNKFTFSDFFKLDNIKSFLEGNLKYYYDGIIGLPSYTKEQILMRFEKCKDTCFTEEGCEYCGCDPIKKAFTIKSCNEGKKFPDLMNKEDWEEYKNKNNGK